jgi:hypothetical protein
MHLKSIHLLCQIKWIYNHEKQDVWKVIQEFMMALLIILLLLLLRPSIGDKLHELQVTFNLNVFLHHPANALLSYIVRSF